MIPGSRTKPDKRPRPGPAVNDSRTLLATSDFTYEGKYTLDGDGFPIGQNLYYSEGLTHRITAGETRFLIAGFDGNGNPMRVVEFARPASLGGTVSSTIRNWNDSAIFQATTTGAWKGLAIDPDDPTRLFTTVGEDYPGGVGDTDIQRSQVVRVMTLNDNGTVSSVRGSFGLGLSNIGGRAHYGGFVKVPSWFQAAYSCPKYATGFGGYASRVAAGGGPGAGLNLFAFPEPTSLDDDTDFSAGVCKRLSDFSGCWQVPDWYTDGTVTPTYDRGRRVTTNYDSHNEPYPNPGTNYHSNPPDPDGFGHWVWADTAWGTGCWIEGDSKYGFVLLPTLGAGVMDYPNATVNQDNRVVELQLFDPADFGACIQGSKQGWQVQPYAMADITEDLTGGGLIAGQTDGVYHPLGVAGATYDATNQKLYLIRYGTGAGGDSEIYQYAVNC
jgi:hypothetical protein